MYSRRPAPGVGGASDAVRSGRALRAQQGEGGAPCWRGIFAAPGGARRRRSPCTMQTLLLLLPPPLLPLSHAILRVPVASVARALPAAGRRIPLPSRGGPVAMDAFPERAYSYEDETTDLKAAIRVALVAGDKEGLRTLVDSLERLNPTERCATSPLLDGYWETLYASTPAAWTRGRRLRHVIESWSEGDAPGMGIDSSPGVPGLRDGPRGTAWTDVAQG